MSRYLFLILIAGLTACSSLEPRTNTPATDNEDSGSFITGRSKSGVSLSDMTGLSDKESLGIPVNALLWRASLDIASILPIDDIDVFSGTLITDWYSLPSQPSEQIKLARSKNLFTVPSQMGLEKITNPFLRPFDQNIRENLNMIGATDVEVFSKIRSLKDNF